MVLRSILKFGAFNAFAGASALTVGAFPDPTVLGQMNLCLLANVEVKVVHNPKTQM